MSIDVEGPGFVIHPDGSRVFVDDRKAYFEKHPEALESTQAAVDFYVKCMDQTAANEAARRKEAESHVPEVKTEAEPDGICTDTTCVKGRIPKACDACRGSFARMRDPDIRKPCSKCEGSKIVYGTCPTCNDADGGMVNALH